MRIYGAVAAITGQIGKPELNCSFCSKEQERSKAIQVHKNYKTTLDFEKEDEANLQNITASFRQFAETLYEYIEMQEKESGSGIKVPIVLGIDGRKKYNMDLIWFGLVSGFCTFLKEKGIEAESFLSKIRIRLGYFNARKTESDGVSHQVDYNQVIDSEIRRQLHAQKINNKLANMEQAIKDGDKHALDYATTIASNYAIKVAAQFKRAKEQGLINRFTVLYPYHPKLKDFPLLNFWSWHTDIKTAFRQAFHTASNYHRHIIVKAINESNPPFVDALECYLQDEQEGLEPEYHYREDEIIDTMRSTLIHYSKQ